MPIGGEVHASSLTSPQSTTHQNCQTKVESRWKSARVHGNTTASILRGVGGVPDVTVLFSNHCETSLQEQVDSGGAPTFEAHDDALDEVPPPTSANSPLHSQQPPSIPNPQSLLQLGSNVWCDSSLILDMMIVTFPMAALPRVFQVEL